MKTLTILGLLTLLAPPVHAEIVDCPVRDRACILQTAEDMIYAYAKDREVLQNKGFTARLARIYWQLPADERDAFVTRLEDFDSTDDADLMYDFNDYLDRVKPVIPTSLHLLETALQTQNAPDGSKFGDYILNGFKSAFADGFNNDAYNLWMHESKIIWSKGQRTYRYLQRWLALNEPEEFNFHTRSKNIAGRHRREVWESLGLVAHLQCTIDPARGELVLEPLLRQFEERSPKDPVIRTYAKAELYRAVLECRDDTAAQAFWDEIMQMRAEAFEFIIQEYPDPAERDFVLSAAHDTIEFSTSRVKAFKLYQDGKEDEARKVFEDGKATVGVFGTTITEDGEVAITPSLNRAPMRWETFVYDAEQQLRYAHGSRSIPYFLEVHDFDVNAKYFDDDALDDFILSIDDVWPSKLAQTAATRIVQISNDLQAANPERYAYFPNKILIELGQRPQPPKCTYSDETLQGMLDQLESYRFRDQSYNFLIDYTHYLDRTDRAKPTDGHGMCLLDQT